MIDKAVMEITIAYLILCHGQPAQVGHLVATLPRESPIFIHIDKRAPRSVYQAICDATDSHPLVHFVRRHRCFWGDFGIVEGVNELIRAAVTSNIPFHRAILLSGSDYPIKSNAEIARILGQSGDIEFIEAFPMHGKNRWSNHAGLFFGPDRIDRFHLRFRSRVWRTPWRRRLPFGYTAWGGSQWWTLTRSALEYIARITIERPALLQYFRNVFIPDESYFQTVLANSPFRTTIAGDDQRLSIWDRPEPPYPALLKPEDIDLLAASDKLFARKFDFALHRETYDLIDTKLRSEPSG